MKSLSINVDIEDSRWSETVDHIETMATHVADLVAEKVQNDCWFLDRPLDFSLNLCLSNDAEVQKLNAEFRGVDAPTNVLSFARSDDDDFEDMLDSEENVELGDVMIAYETMVRQAKELDISLKDHFCHLWAHGVLHVLGYDHQTANEAAQMEGLEIAVLADLGIENPYQDEE
jgi:probable rRNA maturation factor